MKLLSILLAVVLVSIAAGDYSIDDYKAVGNSRNFTGKVVLVTGSSSGIGEGIVKLFSLLGASVVVTGRKAVDISKVAKECLELSPKKLKPLDVVADLTKSDDVNNLIDATIKTYGKLDVLVNNAGIRIPANITKPDILQVWNQTNAINTRAIIELTHLAVPHLDKTNGSIIHISAYGVYAPMKNDLVYSVGKAAMEMSTKILALELAPKGIRVNNVSPGVIQTHDKVSPEQQIAISITPLARLGQPLDIAKVVVFMASTDAQFITGASIVVDGGVVFNAGVANILDRPT